MAYNLQEIRQTRKVLVFAICLNAAFVIAEVIAGYFAHSLALYSDAGHNLVDVISLILTYLAFRLAIKKSTDKYTYGFKKITIYATLLNAVMLLAITASIVYEAFKRFNSDVKVNGKIMIITAFAGILINAFSALLLMKNQKKDLNIKAAFLHLSTDALVSLGVVITGVLIYTTRLAWPDPVVSLLISFVILLSTWSLIRKSVRLSLDGVPPKINLQTVRDEILKIEGVINLHDLHIWALSTFQNAVTVHLILSGNPDLDNIMKIKEQVGLVFNKYHIEHITIDTEGENSGCDQSDC